MGMEFKSTKDKLPRKNILLMKKCYWPKLVRYESDMSELRKVKAEVKNNLAIDGLVAEFNDLMAKVTVKIDDITMTLNVPQFELILKCIEQKKDGASTIVHRDNSFIKRQIGILIDNGIVVANENRYFIGKLKPGDFSLVSS